MSLKKFESHIYETEGVNRQLAIIETRQNELHAQISLILENLDSYSSEATQKKSINFVKTKLKEMAKLMIDLAEEVEIVKTLFDRKLERISSKLIESDTPISTNGCLIWRLNEYSKKEKQSLNQDIVFYSPFCYSSQYGYKFQAGARLNNKGIWKNAILISIEAHSTPWDCLLKWPCKMNVTVVLLDQSNDRSKMKHRTKIFNNISIEKDKHLFKTFLPKSFLQNSFIVQDSILIFF